VSLKLYLPTDHLAEGKCHGYDSDEADEKEEDEEDVVTRVGLVSEVVPLSS